MMGMFQKATRNKVRLRMAIDGPAGSGKTFTALRFAFAISSRVAVINSESGAIQKYLGLKPDVVPFEFDVCDLTDFSPAKYTEAIMAAGREGYQVIVIDSLSHAWAGSGGALELKDKKAGSGGNNSFTAWKDITPMHNAMIEAILRSPAHIIATMRSKTEHVLEVNERGKQVPRKVGMAPIQRAGMEYEFDVYCSMDNDHILTVSKTRCPEIDGVIIPKPGAGFMAPLITWLNEGSDLPPEAFAVTDADLAKFLAKQAASQPAQKQKTADELLAEQLAAQQATAAPTLQAQPATEPNTLDAPIAREVIEQIKGYVDGICGFHPEFADKFRDMMQAKPLSTFTNLEGIKLANNLQRKLAALKEQAAAVPS